MITYVAVVIAVALVLYLSYRALGGGTAVTPEDYRTVLARIGEFTAARAAELDVALQSDATRDRAVRLVEADPLVAAATAARKKLTGYQEQLARLEPDATGHEGDVLESARSLLSAAIEDLGWACRMLEAGNHSDNQGVQRAVTELRAAAAECIGASQRLLGNVIPAIRS
ncbi:MAG TPA: hypothetical protein VGQ42_08405 [Candidatus Dormibacteraeota bacterium]|jgi:hypothetical protein|nr:hypothetical protein [Candidatus Dormibacteraeota bacterium]